MLDLDAIEAALTEPCVALRLVQTDHGGCLDFDVEDLRVLVAELRAAREAKERVLDMHSSNSGGWCWECAHPSPCRTVTALAAPAGAHVHYDDFYDPAGELDDDFDAYRAVVGPA